MGFGKDSNICEVLKSDLLYLIMLLLIALSLEVTKRKWQHTHFYLARKERKNVFDHPASIKLSICHGSWHLRAVLLFFFYVFFPSFPARTQIFPVIAGRRRSTRRALDTRRWCHNVYKRRKLMEGNSGQCVTRWWYWAADAFWRSCSASTRCFVPWLSPDGVTGSEFWIPCSLAHVLLPYEGNKEAERRRHVLTTEACRETLWQ